MAEDGTVVEHAFGPDPVSELQGVVPGITIYLGLQAFSAAHAAHPSVRRQARLR